MRARAAYISSLGTTGILVAAALMMLALVSALVGFRGWPGGTSDSIASVPIASSTSAPAALTQVRRVSVRVPAHPVALRAERTTPRPVRAAATTAGLVKTETAEAAPPHVVKVPRGVEMTLPPTGRPTVPVAPQSDPAAPPPGVEPPGEQPPSIIPSPPQGGPAPDDVQGVVDQVVPLPGPSGGGSGGGLTPQITLAPGTIGVAIGTTNVSVTLGSTSR
jgi:hypothetical protein